MTYEYVTFQDLERALFYAGHTYLQPQNIKFFGARYHGKVVRIDHPDIPGTEYFTVESVKRWDETRIYRVLRVVVTAATCIECGHDCGRTAATVKRNLVDGADETHYTTAAQARNAVNKHLRALFNARKGTTYV